MKSFKNFITEEETEDEMENIKEVDFIDDIIKILQEELKEEHTKEWEKIFEIKKFIDDRFTKETQNYTEKDRVFIKLKLNLNDFIKENFSNMDEGVDYLKENKDELLKQISEKMYEYTEDIDMSKKIIALKYVGNFDILFENQSCFLLIDLAEVSRKNK